MKYKKNYIENFIFRIDFKQNKQEITEKILQQFKTDFIDTLNGLKSRDVINNVIEMNDNEDIAKIASTEKVVEYRLFNKENNEFITITNEYICYENTKYENFEKAKLTINKMIDSLIKSSNIEICTRIGMRFINDIIFPSETKEEIYNWKGYIKEPLLNNIDFFMKNNNQKILQFMHVIDIDSKIDKNIFYTVQYGLYNSRKPGPMLDKQYIIDIDGHIKTVEEIQDVKEKIDIMHSEIEQIFEIIIDDKMRENMGVCEDDK